MSGGGRHVVAVQTADDATDAELAATIVLEFDESRFEHVQIVRLPKIGLDDPPFAESGLEAALVMSAAQAILGCAPDRKPSLRA
jgi:hypothetical protein